MSNCKCRSEFPNTIWFHPLPTLLSNKSMNNWQQQVYNYSLELQPFVRVSRICADNKEKIIALLERHFHAQHKNDFSSPAQMHRLLEEFEHNRYPAFGWQRQPEMSPTFCKRSIVFQLCDQDNKNRKEEKKKKSSCPVKNWWISAPTANVPVKVSTEINTRKWWKWQHLLSIVLS